MASKQIRFALVLHNHQPVGNFEHVFQQAYQDSYEPLLDVLSRYETLKLSMHVSGSLIEWLSTNHPDYLERLADLVARGRLEILGGAFYEPILAMIPSRDRIGQIRSFTRWLEDRLGATVRGMWVPERVWEQSFVRDIVAAGIEYTVLDDFHFKNAGLVESQLYGPYLTEDDGQVMTIFPGSERLRYLIPFAEPQETLDYLGRIANERSDAVVVFGDDGEKFGTWPGTHQHVYTDRWLERFFDPPLGKIYLPESSYREMTEWVLPVEQQLEYERIAHDMSQDLRWPAMRRFMRGGYWRNFKARYPEADEMYARMMAVSRRLGQLVEDGTAGEPIDQARTELYRAQCNCAYWHGAFGGLYLPHLRNAVYHHLIAAEGLMDQATRPAGPWVEAKIEDFNFDGRQEVQLANDRLCALLAPGRGGQMYELDVRAIRHNLLATLARRPEAYHRKVLAGSNQAGEQVASIHDRVVCKQEGLDKWIHYDQHLRKSLLDHFFDREATLEAVAGAQAPERGDFLASVYEARVRRNPDRIQVLLIREGNAAGHAVRITKGVILSAGNSTLEIAYLLEGLPKDQPLHFGVELNFAGLPAGADDRYFRDSKQKRLGQLGSRLDLHDVKGLGLVDEWLGIDAGLSFSRPTHLWTFPIETVSQSEGGFELVHQSVVVLPHWLVSADAEGRWTATVHLALDTSRAESRAEQNALAATV
jgi:alpha-amylase